MSKNPDLENNKKYDFRDLSRSEFVDMRKLFLDIFQHFKFQIVKNRENDMFVNMFNILAIYGYIYIYIYIYIYR